MEPINLNFQLSFKDIEDIILFISHGKRSFNIWINSILLFIFGALAVLSIIHSSNKILNVIFTIIIVFIILGLISPLFTHDKVKKGWQKNTAWHFPIHYEFYDTGFKNETIYDKTETSWDGIYKIEETEKSFVLILPNDYFHIIPRRAFRDITQIEQFKNLLTEKVKEKINFIEKGLSETIPKRKLFQR